jgi:NADH-quinone oxidoreductase subunit M
MIPVLLILIPLLGGLTSFFFRQERWVKSWAFICSVATLAVAMLSFTSTGFAGQFSFDAAWNGQIALPAECDRLSAGIYRHV